MAGAVKLVEEGLAAEQCQPYNTTLAAQTCSKTCRTSSAAPKGAFGSKPLKGIAQVQVGR